MKPGLPCFQCRSLLETVVALAAIDPLAVKVLHSDCFEAITERLANVPKEGVSPEPVVIPDNMASATAIRDGGVPMSETHRCPTCGEDADPPFIAKFGPNPGPNALLISSYRHHHSVLDARGLVMPDDQGNLRCVVCLEIVREADTFVDGAMGQRRTRVANPVTGYERLCCGYDPTSKAGANE